MVAMGEVVSSKGCSGVFMGFSSSVGLVRGMESFEPMCPATSRPFDGLVICVTGLSKEARKQVMEATERLGARYSPHLNAQCTHLVVQSFGGQKLEHALKHRLKNDLFVVTLGWFVDSVRKNVRLSESLYSVKRNVENGTRLDKFNRLVDLSDSGKSCLPVGIREVKQSARQTISGRSMYIDSSISAEMRDKVIEAATKEGVTFLDRWFVGCNANHVVCEGNSILRYLGHCNYIVTPLWVLKTTKEKNAQRLVHISADLAKQIGTRLEDFENGVSQPMNGGNGHESVRGEERQRIVNLAKLEVRNRRGSRIQTLKNPISLLDSTCWSVSDPPSTASIRANSNRLLDESEKSECIFKNRFLTILFPIDRFGEMGPSSRTFFSETGFTRLQILDHVYGFYQENMSGYEIEAAIHTDSRHANRLRSVYADKETGGSRNVINKRVDFLGSRKSFETLRRVGGNDNCIVYEFLVRA